MKRPRAPWFQLCMGLTLMLGLAITPVLTMAADPPRIVGTWEGVLDPGAQPKKHIVVHISADQDGSLSGTIDYPDQDVLGNPDHRHHVQGAHPALRERSEPKLL